MTTIIPHSFSHHNEGNIHSLDLERFVNEALPILHRGGMYGYFWTLPQKQTYPFPFGNPSNFPLNSRNVYYGVNPTNKDAFQGRKVLGDERATLSEISAVNTLFAEFDAKEYGDIKADLEGAKQKALAHIKALPLSPSMLIDSGGGYHVYHFLQHPFFIKDDVERLFIAGKLKTWVKKIGGSKGVNDLTRILRVPGTKNYKPEYPHPLPVKLVELDATRLYALEELVPDVPATSSAASSPSSTSDDALTPYMRHVQNKINKDEHFRGLWNGNKSFWEGVDKRYPSQSEADQALANRLTFIAKGDQDIAKELFKLSQLYREQGKGATYLDNTIAKAYEAWLEHDQKQQTKEAAKQAVEFNLFTLNDAWGFKPPKWKIDKFIFDREYAVIFGSRGTGKTTWTLSKVLPSGCKTLYFAGEDLPGVINRIKGWCQYYRVDKGDLPIILSNTRFDLTNSTDVANLIDIIKEHKIEILILDPIAFYIGAVREKEADDWQIVINSFKDIMEATGCAIGILHHEGYAKGHPRGSTKILDLAASSTGLSATDDERRVELKQGRPPKNSAPIPDYEAYIKHVEVGIDEETGEKITAPVIVENPKLSFKEIARLPMKHEQVLKLFVTSGQDVLQRKYITSTTGLANDTVGEILKLLTARGYVRREKLLYQITDEGRKALERASG